MDGPLRGRPRRGWLQGVSAQRVESGTMRRAFPIRVIRGIRSFFFYPQISQIPQLDLISHAETRRMLTGLQDTQDEKP
jgi:hypothetical protein